jgi:ketosteroid isomerase-like protein
MSQENVEIVRKMANVFRSDPEAGLQCLDAEAVMDWTASRAPYSGVYRGHAEIRRMWQATSEAWDEWTTEIREAIELDRETVVLVTLVRARGKGSGILVEAHGASIWSLRDGKVTYAKLFQNKTEALAAVGLSEQDAHADS